MKVKTMAVLKKEILAIEPNYTATIDYYDRFNIEAIAERLGIAVFIKETHRTTFERLIGYDFGSCVLKDIARIGSKKQYILELPNGDTTVCLYKEFKDLIKGCDYPKK